MPLKDEEARKQYKKKWYQDNKVRLAEKKKIRRQSDPDTVRAIDRESYVRNKSKKLEYARKYNMSNKEDVDRKKREWNVAHKDEINERRRNLRKENWSLVIEREQRQYLRRKYGITLEQYNVMLEKQDGVCAICGGITEGKHLAVDHDHVTGQLRGLLCDMCNRGIGLLGDSIDRVGAALDYLKMYGGV